METVEEFKFKVWLPHLRISWPLTQEQRENGQVTTKYSPLKP